MKKAVEIFNKLSVTLTPQRLAIIEFLNKNKQHPTVDKIFKAIRKRYPSISMATVYSTLQLLKTTGEIQELSIRKDKACYDHEPKPHHHLLCCHCKRIIDIEINCPLIKKGVIKGHKVDEVQAYIYGQCSDCRKVKNKRR